MAIIHTIRLQNEVKNPRCVTGSTRRSETRQYAACLVATATEASVALAAEKLVAIKGALIGAEIALATLEAERGMTAAEARLQNKVEHDRWYDAGKIFEVERTLRALSVWSTQARKDTEAAAKEKLVAAGFVDPYDPTSTWGLCLAGDRVNDLRYKVEKHRERTLGEQSVLSWHLTAANAEKALGGRDASYFRDRGDTVEVRTDIEIRESSRRR
jgi:hypothetical protein